MVITVTCPSCSSAFPVDPAKIPERGVNARCSSCGDIFRVERPAPEPELPTLEDFAPDPAPAAATMEAPAAPAPTPPLAPPKPAAAPAPPKPPAVPAPPKPPPPAPPVVVAPPAPAAAPPRPAPPPPAPPAVDPFEEAAPFEAAPAPAAEPASPAVTGFTFGKRDPTDKAKRLARVLVSDMIMYNAERHQSALAQGTLLQDFEDEIEKSWKEFVEQVGEELANGVGRQFWTEALNDILAKGEQVF